MQSPTAGRHGLPDDAAHAAAPAECDPEEEEATASEAAAGGDGDDVSEAAPTSLLSLPPALLAAHLWPLLSPWTRMQLRATCRELRAWADGLLEPARPLCWVEGPFAARSAAGRATAHATSSATSRYSVCADEDEPGQSSSITAFHASTSAQPDPDESTWDIMCRMLPRCPRINGAKLVLGPADDLDLTTARRMRTASAGRIQRLSLRGMGGITPTLLRAAAAACPSLQHLDLDMYGAPGPSVTADAGAVAAATRKLPSSIHTLRMVLTEECNQAGQPYVPLPSSMLAAATHLTNLRSLDVPVLVNFGEHGGTRNMHLDASMFIPVASHLTRLHILSYCGTCRLRGMPALLATCGPSLQELKMPLPGPADPPLAKLLQHTPQLRRLELTQATSQATSHASDTQAIAARTSLTSLAINNAGYAAQLCSTRAVAPGSLGHLRQLHVRDLITVEDLSALLCSQLLSSGCQVVLDDPKHTMQAGGSRARLAAVLRDKPMRLQSALSDHSLVAGTCNVNFENAMQEDNPAGAQLLAGLNGLVISRPWQMDVMRGLWGAVAHEAAGGSRGRSAVAGQRGVWLLPAMRHMTVLVLMVDEQSTKKTAQLLCHLPAVLSAGYLPLLTSLVLDHKGGAHREAGSCHAQLLAPIARLLAAHPGITVRLVPAPSAWALEQLRLQALGLKDSMQLRPKELGALMAWLVG